MMALPYTATVLCPDRYEIETILSDYSEGILGDIWRFKIRRFASHDAAEAWAEALCFEVSTRVDIYAAQSVEFGVWKTENHD